MTKKDYELIARELRQQHEMFDYNAGKVNGSETTVYKMSCNMWAQTLASTNPLFDKERFVKACGTELVEDKN